MIQNLNVGDNLDLNANMSESEAKEKIIRKLKKENKKLRIFIRNTKTDELDLI